MGALHRRRRAKGRLAGLVRREWEGARDDPAGALLMFFTGVGLGLLTVIMLNA